VDEVVYTRRDLYSIATLTSSLKIDGHRADLVILKAARAQAAFDGRRQINHNDILLATELAIPHRLKRGPFTDAQMSMSTLEEQLNQVMSEWGEGDEIGEVGEDGDQQAVKKKVNP
jgi:Mg-chelatase subunit ChlI